MLSAGWPSGAGHRLAWGFVAAVALHALVLGLIRAPASMPQWPARLLSAELRSVDETSATASATGASSGRPRTADAPDASGLAVQNEVAASAAASVSALVESARRQARSFAVEQKSGAVAQADRPGLPQLDRALRKAPAGERLLGNGVLKITDADGRSYCLRAPPDFPRDGPLPYLAVPMTCP